MRAFKLGVSGALLGLAAIVTLAATAGFGAPLHERKEVAGLAVVFGAEPEPALTEEMQFLRWRVSTLAEEEPYSEFQDAKVVIAKDGEELGTFQVRGSRRDPGLYQTRHIFTADGEYDSVLSFRKGEAEEVHTVDFKFRIAARSSLEIPPRKSDGR